MDIYEKIESLSQDIFNKLVLARRHIHKNPELGMETFKTADFIENYLSDCNITARRMVNSSAVTALIKGHGEGRTIALRADIDALRIKEENDIEYKSQNSGLMHACGHDFHTVCLLGAAEILNSIREDFKGSVKLIFQPAEETISGALEMLKEGIFEDPAVDACAGLHIWPQIPQGQIGIVKGACFSTINNFIITVKGKGGHGAIPYLTKDPITAGVNIVNSLNSIISRQINSFMPAVLSVCSFNSGNSVNIIPDEAVIKGTIRTFNKELRIMIENRVTDICKGISKAMGVDVLTEFVFDAPPVINDDVLTEMFISSARKMLGNDNVLTDIDPSMVSEDFSYFSELVPSVYYFLGGRNEEKGYVNSLHSPHFNADEECIKVGSKIFAGFAVDYLNNK